ncbi:hypothetical protein [Arenimonas sp. MALMAid1274]|uniref:hypothetical protein n=1 Tax=Arenimonas sp. MALMAid1274 TaxID=3411630 RepID=UPI003B9F7564
MSAAAPNTPTRRGNPWRIPVWTTAAGLLLLPAIAMQFTDEVDWTAGDFVVMGVMLGTCCLVYELGARLSGHWAYRAGFGVAIAAGFLMTWINLAVGIVGNENNPVNQLFFGILMVGAIAAAIGRFRPQGMARAMVATALAQAAVMAWIALAGHGYVVVLSGFFIAAWLSAAHLFRTAAETTHAP